jgi:simple sugar transport system substrate-binding protein
MHRFSISRRGFLKAGTAAAGTVALAGLPGLVKAAGKVTVGFIYVGPKDDFGYNQAHAEGAAALKSIDGVIRACIDQDPRAHCRVPSVMMRQG